MTDARVLRSINPATGELVGEHAVHDEAEVARRLERAGAAYDGWRRRTFAERAPVLVEMAARLRAGQGRLAALMTEEMGKPIAEAEAEVGKCAWVCEHYAEHAASFLAPEPIATEARDSFVRFDPLGAVLAVMPWNFPLWQVFRFGAPALMAGNVMLIKHAPNVTGCALAIEALGREAGLPEGALTALLVPETAVPAIVGNPVVQAVTLTGSERAGSAVGALAGAAIKKSVLELGGSDPFVVLADADLEAALDVAVIARTLNSGQSCIAAKRFLVEESIADAFEQGFAERMGALPVGDPADRAHEVGPLAREDLRTNLERQVQASLEAGARVATGGERLGERGWFYAPTVLVGVDEGMAAFDEETFGPVAAVRRVRDADEAVAIANRSRYGLGASVWTRDLDRARDLAARLEVGCVFVNKMTGSDPRVPFGGVKRSGYGRELGPFGIREFVNVKTVWVA